MTESEAIKKVKEFGLYHAIGDLPNSALTVKAFKMAVAALEKQAPKKIIITSKNGSYVYYKCPNCDHEIGSAFHYSPNEYMMEHKFCEKCGQSIDWSETI